MPPHRVLDMASFFLFLFSRGNRTHNQTGPNKEQRSIGCELTSGRLTFLPFDVEGVPL